MKGLTSIGEMLSKYSPSTWGVNLSLMKLSNWVHRQSQANACCVRFIIEDFFQSMLPSVQYYIEYIINMCALHINLIDHDIYFKIQSSNYGPLTANQGPLQQKNHGRRVGSVTKRTQATRTNRNATNDQRNFLKEKLNSPPGLWNNNTIWLA